VAPALEIRIDDDVRERLPDLRVHALAFAGARVGMANRKLEPLRDRVLAEVRERLSAARDVRRIPTLAAFHRGFPEITRSSRRAWLDEAFLSIARRDPFRVMNDAIDAARLLAFHYAVPVSAHDASRIAGPVVLQIAAPGATINTIQGALVDQAGLPVLRDRNGVLGSPFFESQRAMPSTRTRDLVVLAYHAGGEPALDPDEFRSRAENWLASLLGAQLGASTEAT
jgi:DNA/RNA-binding domain of Phe-tRNA-synthetase-like protein